MSDVNDIRSLLTSKSRAKVTPRDNSLARREKGESEPSTAAREENQTVQLDSSKLTAELDNLPTVGKRLAVHLEQGIRTDLMKLCENNDITPEIFIEAAIALLKEHPDQISKVIADAQVRLAKRKRAGLVRRTLAMMEKYGSSD